MTMRDVFRLRAEAVDAGHQVVIIQVEPLGDRPQVLFFQDFARQNQAERGVVIDDHPAVAVQDAAARRQDRHGLDAVLQRPLVVELGILHLEPPEAGDQEQEDGDAGVLKNGDFAGGEIGIVAQRRLVRLVLISRFGSTGGRITTEPERERALASF